MTQSPEALEARLQPPKPASYRLPPVVQPNWGIGDMLGAWPADPYEALRRELCRRYGVRHCLLLDRARSGLFLLSDAFGIRGEWIISSLMHRPSAALLLEQGGGVALADVDEQLCIDPASVQRMLSPRSRAILATHTYGKTADLAALRRHADQAGVLLVENAVHTPGNLDVQGKPVGSWGDATMLSFNVDKPLGGILGGALLTDRDDIWRAVSAHPLGAANAKETRERILTTYLAYRLKALLLRLPQGRRYRAAADGVAEIEAFAADSYRRYTPRRIHRLQAAVALACVRREDGFVARRRRNAERLTKRLQGLPGLALPESTGPRPHAYTYYPVVLREGSRYDLGARLAEAGIETKWRYYPLHLQPGFGEVRKDDLSRTERLWGQHLVLPAGVGTDEEGIDYLGDSLARALA
ncbi:MAG TPA: DegT/DnrJ/EryC1/StrS family aminotransferase [Gammaproteobacteria bacterium]|jgi:dTDP-4-amino-4,6-dideoxygalactose transaminase